MSEAGEFIGGKQGLVGQDARRGKRDVDAFAQQPGRADDEPALQFGRNRISIAAEAIGGAINSDARFTTNTLQIFDIAASSWTYGPPAPPPRAVGVTGVMNGPLLVALIAIAVVAATGDDRRPWLLSRFFPWLQLPAALLATWLTTIVNPLPSGMDFATWDFLYASASVAAIGCIPLLSAAPGRKQREGGFAIAS